MTQRFWTLLGVLTACVVTAALVSGTTADQVARSLSRERLVSGYVISLLTVIWLLILGRQAREPKRQAALALAIARGDAVAIGRALRKVNVNGSATGCTALARATFLGRIEICRQLLDAGAVPDAANYRGYNALCAAADVGQVLIAHLLIQAGANPSHQMRLHTAEQVQMARLDPSADPELGGCTPLILATVGGHHNLVDLLILAGADLEAEADEGETALSLAAAVRRVSVVSQLLSAGADPNHANAAGRTPLMVAASTGAKNLCRALIDAGATLDAKDREGRTFTDYLSASSGVAAAPRMPSGFRLSPPLSGVRPIGTGSG